MSKSLGNVIDPLEVIHGCSLQSLLDKLQAGNLAAKEVTKAKKDLAGDFPDGIPELGSDALRFGLLAYTVQGRDVNLDIKRVVGYRNFCNKLWNATRFALQFLTDFGPTPGLLEELMSSNKMALRDRYMISRLMACCDGVNTYFSEYKFGDAQMASYSYWMDDLCDVYLELIKPVVYDVSPANKDARWAAQATLWIALEAGLRILHPMMPFVTEELWQRLPGRGTLGKDESETIMLTGYPETRAEYRSVETEADMDTVKAIIKACRSLRSQYNITNKVMTKFFVKNTSAEGTQAVSRQVDDIRTLGKAKEVVMNPNETDVPSGVGIVIVDEQTTVSMDLTGLVDYQAEIAKLNKALNKTLPVLTQLETKMNASGYAAKVSDELKQSNETKLEGLKKKTLDMREAIAKFETLMEMEKESNAK